MYNESDWLHILTKINAHPSNWKLVAGKILNSHQRLLSGNATNEDLKALKNNWKSLEPFIDNNGNPFVLYIYDQSFTHHRGRGYKFHISWCQALENMRGQGRFARYKAKYDLDNSIFKAKKDGVEMELELRVCKYCLSKIQYQGYVHGSHNAEQIYEAFNLQEFITEYASSSLKELLSPTHQYSIGDYTSDWPQVRNRILRERGYKCEQCGSGTSLVVHHINGVKDDNRNNNLKVLCRECHAKEPMHGHLST